MTNPGGKRVPSVLLTSGVETVLTIVFGNRTSVVTTSARFTLCRNRTGSRKPIFSILLDDTSRTSTFSAKLGNVNACILTSGRLTSSRMVVNIFSIMTVLISIA